MARKHRKGRQKIHKEEGQSERENNNGYSSMIQTKNPGKTRAKAP